MTPDNNLGEIREKIYQLRTAIMYSMSNEVCKLPNSIVTALRVDDEGQLWFLCPKPLQAVAEFEDSFPVRLHFYHKGVFFHLEVSGKASIVNDNYLSSEHRGAEQMLVRMSMSTVEYTEPYGKKERSRIEHLLEKVYKWVLKNVTHWNQQPGPVFSKNTM
jgi:hypothetical protein